jgi:predicted nucleic acid-binding protein
MIILDAGVLIGHLRGDDPFHVAASEFLEEHEELDWGVSCMTVAESLVHPVREGRGVSVLGALERLHILPLDFAGTDMLGLAEVRAASGLRMPDAIVLYTAESHGAELVTTERTLARAADDRRVTAHLLEAA